VDATSKNIAEGILRIGADGVVKNISDHPVCAAKVASQLFLIAQPPLLLRRGLAALHLWLVHWLEPTYNPHIFENINES
jgi:hypothetical protein